MSPSVAELAVTILWDWVIWLFRQDTYMYGFAGWFILIVLLHLGGRFLHPSK